MSLKTLYQCDQCDVVLYSLTGAVRHIQSAHSCDASTQYEANDVVECGVQVDSSEESYETTSPKRRKKRPSKRERRSLTPDMTTSDECNEVKPDISEMIRSLQQLHSTPTADVKPARRKLLKPTPLTKCQVCDSAGAYNAYGAHACSK